MSDVQVVPCTHLLAVFVRWPSQHTISWMATESGAGVASNKTPIGRLTEFNRLWTTHGSFLSDTAVAEEQQEAGTFSPLFILFPVQMTHPIMLQRFYSTLDASVDQIIFSHIDDDPDDPLPRYAVPTAALYFTAYRLPSRGDA